MNASMQTLEVLLWRRIIENFVAVLIVLFYDSIVFGQRAETLLRQKIAQSLRISSRLISKVVKHYTDPCGHCQARASLECEAPLLELLELGYEQRQLVAFAAMEPSLWHPDFAKEGFTTLCETIEEIRLHAISLRRTLELVSWTTANSDCNRTNTIVAIVPSSAQVPSVPSTNVVMELGAPLLQSVGYLEASFKSLAHAITAVDLELPDNMMEVNEILPDLFDSYSAILARVDRKSPQIINSQSAMHSIVSLADTVSTLWQALCSVADDQDRVAALVAQQQEIRKKLERHQRLTHAANKKRLRELQFAANGGRKKFPALSSLRKKSPSLRTQSPKPPLAVQIDGRPSLPWQPWQKSNRSAPVWSAGGSPNSSHGSLLRLPRPGHNRSGSQELITKRWSEDAASIMRLQLEPLTRAYTDEPIPAFLEGLSEEDLEKRRLFEIVSIAASLIEDA
jgi:hypothetical protein